MRFMTVVRKDKEGGYVLVTVAALLFVLVGFMALAIDTGVLLGARTSSQRAADAAALAGAVTFLLDGSSPQPDTAILHAKQTALSNKVLGTSIEDAQVDVQVNADNGIDPRRVTVTITRSEPTFLAKVLNVNTVDTKVTGVAELGRKSTGAKCVKPFFIPNTILSTKAPCDACVSGEKLVSNGEVTAFAEGLFGQQITAKQSDKTSRLASSQYYAINLTGDNSSGSVYRTAISSCLQDFFVCKSSYPTVAGDKKGPTKSGINDLIGNPPDLYQSIGHYLRQTDGTVRDTSKSLVIAPIWDECTFVDSATGTPYCPTGDFPSGSGTSLEIEGWAVLFIDGMGTGSESDSVKAELVKVIACSTTPPTGVDADAGTVLSLPLRLVRPQ